MMTLRLCCVCVAFSLGVWGCGTEGEVSDTSDVQSSGEDGAGASSEGDSAEDDVTETEVADVESGTGGDAGGGDEFTGPAPGCEDFVGIGNPEEIAKSPRENVDAERLALRLSGEVVAPDMEYERIAADLTAIGASTDEVDHIHAFPSFGVSGLTCAFSESVIDAIDDGSYAAWDCHHDRYGMKDYSVFKNFTYNVNISFHGIFNPELLVEAYQDLPGLDSIEASGVMGDGNNISLCTASFGGTHRYSFYEGRGDCPAGCTGGALWGFDVTEAGEVTALPFWEYGDGAADPNMPQPDWVEAPCP